MTLTTVLIITASALTVTLAVMVFIQRLRRQRRQVPGPTGYPVLGMLLQVLPLNTIHQTLTSMGARYGRAFQFRMLGKNVVVLRSASIVERAFNDVDMDDRKETFFQTYIFNGKGFAFANYKSYVPELRQLFHKVTYWDWEKQQRDDPGARGVISRLATRLLTAQGEGHSNVDPDPHIKRVLTDVFSHKLMGETLPEGDKDQDALWELINHLYSLLDPKIDAPLRAMPFLRFLPIKHGRIFKDTIAARDRVSKRYFDTQKDSYEEGKIRGLVDVCLKIQQEERAQKGDSWLTDEYIKGLMYDTVVAGMSEMLKSIRMLILLMCHYEDIQSRVQTEIDDVIGLRASPSSSHRSEMPYTQAVILEMLRYVSQTPLAIPHKCNKDVVLDGYLIEKDAGIFPNIWGIHHDEEIWGDPWTFRPERFLNEEGQLLPKDNAVMKSLIPFSVGKRRCPGEEFAMTRLFLIFTSMLQKLNFRSPIDEELPSADPRLYSNMYPLLLPQYKCRALRRDPVPESSV